MDQQAAAEKGDTAKKAREDEMNYTYRIKSLSTELNAHYPSKVKELAKSEVKLFENLHK